jgi:DNA invertase Pin-like site-specific DNA recombinase
MIRLTIESAAQLRAKAQTGASLAECARAFGVSWSQAKRVAAGENWRAERRRNPNEIDAVRVARIRELLAAGEKATWIAFEVGVSHATVFKFKNRGTVRSHDVTQASAQV